ncbi:MAG: ATP-binding protein [Firmicutes bacterium]|nr:ATP-binding protein [Bacillota bacterium]
MISKLSNKMKAIEQLRLVIDTIPIPVMLFDSEHNFVDCNQETVKTFALYAKEDFGTYLKYILPPYQPNHLQSKDFFNGMLDSSNMHGQLKNRFVYQRMDGILLYTDTSCASFTLGEDHVVVCSVHDLTLRRRAMEQMREANATADLMLDSIPMACFLVRRDYIAVDCNKEAARLFNFKTKEDALHNYNNIFPTNPSKDFLDRLIKENDSATFEYTCQDSEGNPVAVNMSLIPINYHGEMVAGTYLQDLRDIKEVYVKAKNWETANNENIAKNQFLARMSHEIRTPVSVIRGIADIQLQKMHIDPDVEEAFMQINRSAILLTGIINDLLDLSKVVAGKLEIEDRPYETASLIMDTVQFNLMNKNSSHIKFVLDVDENLPISLIGDELRIKQILNNLLSNAFKYTSEGTVALELKMEQSEEEDTAQLCISVTDTGQGMTKEQLNTLFNNEYVRFNSKENKYVQGTGLGMHITYQLLKLMGGKIKVDSKKGEGTFFHVTIPQKNSDSRVLGKQAAYNLRNYEFGEFELHKKERFEFEPMPYGKVLVVDDQESNLYVARGLLSSYGLNIQTATSGFEVVEKVKQGNIYDIIFMDHMMPEMDGIETAKTIKSMGYSNPIVALTANTILGQSELFLSNGFSGFLSKPIELKNLNTVLIRLIRSKYPDDVIEAAKAEWLLKQESKPDDKADKTLSDGIRNAFISDVSKTIQVLQDVLSEKWTESALQNFVIAVHGIKSSLANIGEKELAHTAQVLEDAGNKGNTSIIQDYVDNFIENLQEHLKTLTAEQEESKQQNAKSDDDCDWEFLLEQLNVLKNEAASYNKKSSKATLDAIKQHSWPTEVQEAIETLSSMLLHSEFDEIAVLIVEMKNNFSLQMSKA